MDKVSSQQRSLNMSRIKYKGTKPELLVRKVLWSAGYRYRLNVSSLPGKPDLFISKSKTAIFINGCFWHQHKNCKRNFMPKSRVGYWKPKLEKNVNRLAEQISIIEGKGIKVITIWECETRDINELKSIILARIEEGNSIFQSQTEVSRD